MLRYIGSQLLGGNSLVREKGSERERKRQGDRKRKRGRGERGRKREKTQSFQEKKKVFS